MPFLVARPRQLPQHGPRRSGYHLPVRTTLTRLLFWRRPEDRLREFAETEAFGARDLARAAETARDPWLRRQLVRHAADEVRHASLLAEGASKPVRAGLGAAVAGDSVMDAGVDMERMGEVDFLAFVHVAEKRATEEFALHRAALGDRGEVFDSILADERRHVAWTGHALDRHRAGGRGREVDAALRKMRRARLVGAWLWFARRLSLVMSTIALSLVFYLVLAPFSLTRGRRPGGWKPGTVPRLDREF